MMSLDDHIAVIQHASTPEQWHYWLSISAEEAEDRVEDRISVAFFVLTKSGAPPQVAARALALAHGWYEKRAFFCMSDSVIDQLGAWIALGEGEESEAVST